MKLDRVDARKVENAQGNFDRGIAGLVQQVREQKLHAKPTRQIRMLFDEHDDLYNQCQAGVITAQEFKKVERLILDDMTPVMVHTVSEFLVLLKALGVPEQNAQKIAAHENDHVHQALQMGLEAEYALVYSRNSDGQYILHPFMIWNVPVGLDQALIHRVEELVASAPENLSDADVNQLLRLKGK